MGFAECFDVVTLFHVLEHVPDPRRTLVACRRALRPGGIVVIAVPNDIDSFQSRRNRFLGRLGSPKYLPLGKTGLPKLTLDTADIDLSHFRSPTLRHALEREGLEVIEDSLDPFFAARRMRKLRRFRRYYTHRAIQRVTQRNFYETIWMVARRPWQPFAPVRRTALDAGVKQGPKVSDKNGDL